MPVLLLSKEWLVFFFNTTAYRTPGSDNNIMGIYAITQELQFRISAE